MLLHLWLNLITFTYGWFRYSSTPQKYTPPL
jgi:hypothetical protein